MSALRAASSTLPEAAIAAVLLVVAFGCASGCCKGFVRSGADGSGSLGASAQGRSI